jgi:hypothetical protein
MRACTRARTYTSDRSALNRLASEQLSGMAEEGMLPSILAFRLARCPKSVRPLAPGCTSPNLLQSHFTEFEQVRHACRLDWRLLRLRLGLVAVFVSADPGEPPPQLHALGVLFASWLMHADRPARETIADGR